MTAIDGTPQNLNYLATHNFRLNLKRSPHLNFFCQEIKLPSIYLPPVEVANPFATIPFSGDQIAFEPLEVSFRVDEDLQNYVEMFSWLTALGSPENFGPYKALQEKPEYTGQGLTSDIEVQIQNNHKMANYGFTFVSAWPYELSGLEFETRVDDVRYSDATVKFRYIYYTIDKIV